MRKEIIVVGLAVLFLGSVSYALDPVGAPKAMLGQGKWSFGVEYAHSEFDIETEDEETPFAPFLTQSLQADKVYANVRYGLCDRIDVFARVGASTFEQDAGWFGFSGFEGEAALAWGLGAAGTLYHKDKLDWGLLLQFSHGESSQHILYLGRDYRSEIDVRTIEVATGPTYQIKDDLAAYGGLFYFALDGDYEGALGDYSFDAESSFGVFAGLNWEVKEDALFNVELQYVGSGFAVATGLRWMLE